MIDPVHRRLARDHWVRLHGTPRVTVLVGGERGRALWAAWLFVSNLTGTLLDGEFEDRIHEAVGRAIDEPGHPIAVLVSPEAVAHWRAGRRDRIAAMVDEGWIVVDDDPVVEVVVDREPAVEPPIAARPPSEPVVNRSQRLANLDARSLAEVTMYEALEATPATAGRFALNESLSVRFGPAAAEIDLLSRGDRIAIEIDGIHHFDDPDCYRRDRRKDLLLQTHGFVVVRLLAEDVMRDVRPAVNAVCQALAYRLAEREQ